MKGCIEPFNGQLWFGGRTLCFRQPRAQKILTGDSGPSLFLDTRYKTQDTGHKKRVRNQLLPVSASAAYPQLHLPLPSSSHRSYCPVTETKQNAIPQGSSTVEWGGAVAWLGGMREVSVPP